MKKIHDYLVCIDSDGCVIDSMTLKHQKAFGPLMIEVFDLDPYREEILDQWDRMNLYSLARGINRFKGLYEILKYTRENYCPISEFEDYEKWIKSTDNFSNQSLEGYLRENPSPILEKVLSWSRLVNQRIEAFDPSEIKAFSQAKLSLEEIKKYADIAIVSSANEKAVREEWQREGLLDFASYICTQEMGTKAYAIAYLEKTYGYEKEKILKIGDALGDYRAAEENQVGFYPIKAQHEEESWRDFRKDHLHSFIENRYRKDYETKLIEDFIENLS